MNLLKLVSNYISNDGPNGYTVNFCCPEVNIGGKVPEFIAAYFLMQGGGSTSHAGAAVQLFNGLLKFVHAGTPVLGKLKIEKGYLDFTPAPGSSLVMKGCKMVRIPLDDISSAKVGQYKTIYEAVYVDTMHGQFKFLITPAYLGSTMGPDICRLLTNS